MTITSITRWSVLAGGVVDPDRPRRARAHARAGRRMRLEQGPRRVAGSRRPARAVGLPTSTAGLGVDEVRSTLPTADRRLTAPEAAALATGVIARIDAVS